MPELTTIDRINFNLRLPYTGAARLLLGQLVIHTPKKVYAYYEATSGCIGYQFKGAQKLKGRGPLPASAQIAPLDYRVSTSPVSLKQVKGVEGNFYPITPFMVSYSGINRGDFGIHADKNVPGSAGCIVLPMPIQWHLFEQLMQVVRSTGVKDLPLSVNYL